MDLVALPSHLWCDKALNGVRYGQYVITRGDPQYVCGIDDHRHVVVVKRTVGQNDWTFTDLSSIAAFTDQFDNDTHNSPSCALEFETKLAEPLILAAQTQPVTSSFLTPVDINGRPHMVWWLLPGLGSQPGCITSGTTGPPGRTT